MSAWPGRYTGQLLQAVAAQCRTTEVLSVSVKCRGHSFGRNVSGQSSTKINTETETTNLNVRHKSGNTVYSSLTSPLFGLQWSRWYVKNIFKTESSGGQTYEKFLDKGVTSHLFLHDKYEATCSSYRQSFIDTKPLWFQYVWFYTWWSSHQIQLYNNYSFNADGTWIKPG